MTSGLELIGLTVRREGRSVLTDITATLPPGTITAVVGPNGAGKSTLLAAVAGALAYDGQVRRSGTAVARADIAYMPQTVGLGSALTVLETMLLGRIESLGYRVGRPDLAAAAQALERFGLAPLAQRPMKTLSGGQQQLALLTQRLMRRPAVLLLDEPTSALDLRHQLLALEELGRFAQANGAVVLVAMHDLTLASRFAEDLLLLSAGCLVRSGAPDLVLDRESVRHVYGVEAEVLRSADGHLIVAPMAATIFGDWKLR